MDKGRTIASIGFSIALMVCCANAHATTAQDIAAPGHVADRVSAQRVSLADGSPSGRHEPSPARVESQSATSKPDEPSSPGSDSFVLLGMLVVLIGVVARQKRRFSRSGTILSR